MRVITPYGFGEISEWQEFGRVKVRLDKPYLNSGEALLDRKSEVFRFSDWGIARVLNISGHGFFSNLQFYESPEAAEAAFRRPTPPDETAFLLDFQSWEAVASQELGLLAEDKPILIIRPWIDRWATEHVNLFTDLFENPDEALTAFENEVKSLASATGIASATLIDTEKKVILAFSVTVGPPQGVALYLKNPHPRHPEEIPPKLIN